MADKQSIISNLMGPPSNKENRSASPASRAGRSSRPTSVLSMSTGLATPTTGRQHKLKQRFTVIKKLGKGTYGKVQLAINKETGQEVAIKTIKKTKIENEQDLQRVRREIQIMSSIEHPHIIHIYEVFENKDKIVLVMQYAPGGELYEYVSQAKLLDDSEARRIFRQIATAIYYCHENKICHRDLKLENILLDEKNNAKLADFGLSNVFDKRRQLRTFCGSPLYASPEIVQGSPYLGPEVDCWSLGVLLYTLVYGAMPFDGSNFKRLVKQICEASYFEPKQKSQASPLIRRLLCAESSNRATILDICSDAWVNGVSIPASPDRASIEQTEDASQVQQRSSHQNLLKVAKDMADLTPVRLDILMALAPTSPSILDSTREPLAPLRVEADNQPDQVKKPAPTLSVFDTSAMQVDEGRATSPIASYIVRDLDDDREAIEPDNEVRSAETACNPEEQCDHQMDAQEESFNEHILAQPTNEKSFNETTKLILDDKHSQPDESENKLESIKSSLADQKSQVEMEAVQPETTATMDHSIDLESEVSSSVNSARHIEEVKVATADHDQSDSGQKPTEPNIESTQMDVDQQSQPKEDSVLVKKSKEVQTTDNDLPLEKTAVQTEDKPKKVKKKVIVVKRRKKVVKKEKGGEATKDVEADGLSRRSSLDQATAKTPIKQKPGKVRIPDTFQSSDSEGSKPVPESSKSHTETRRPSALVIDVSQRLLQQGAAAYSPPITGSSGPQLPNARVSDKKDEFERRASLAAQQPERPVSRLLSQDGNTGPDESSAEPIEDGHWSHESKTPTADRAELLADETSDKFDPNEMERKLAECLEKLESVVAEQSARSPGSTLDAIRDDRSDSVETIKGELSPAPAECDITNRSSLSINLAQSGQRCKVSNKEEIVVEPENLDGSQSSLGSGKSLMGPAPITRSYKKVTFTKDGACVTETGKVYSTKSEDGTVRHIERKSKVTHYPPSVDESSGKGTQTEQREEEEVVVSEEDGGFAKSWKSNSRFHSSSSRSSQLKPFEKLIMPSSGAFQSNELIGDLFLTRNRSPHVYSQHTPLGRQDSNSSCSSGSTDIFDDIFDHWTGAISMFRRSSRPKFAFPTLDDQNLGEKSLFDRFRANRSRESSAEPGLASFFSGNSRCESAEPSSAHGDMFESRRAQRGHKNSRRGWRSKYDEIGSARAAHADPSGYESDVAGAPVWPRRANSSLGQRASSPAKNFTGEESGLGESFFGKEKVFNDDLFSELQQEHEQLRKTIADQHKQLWKGSTPSLLDGAPDTFGALPPLGLSSQRPRVGLGQMLHTSIKPLEGFEHRPRSCSGWSGNDGSSVPPHLRASVALDSSPKRTCDTSSSAEHLPPQPVRRSVSKSSFIADQLASVQLGGDKVRLNGSGADCQPASFIELKRTSSSSDRQQLVREGTALTSSASGLDSSFSNVWDPTANQATPLSQSSGQPACTGDFDSRIQNWLQNSATNLSISSGSLKSYSTNLSSSRLLANSRHLEMAEQQRASLLPPVAVQRSSSRTSSSQVNLANQIQVASLSRQGELMHEQHEQQVSRQLQCELSGSQTAISPNHSKLDELARASSSTSVSKSTIFSKSTSIRVASNTAEQINFDTSPGGPDSSTIEQPFMLQRGAPSTAPVGLDSERPGWGPNASLWRISDESGESSALEQTNSASSSLLEQLRSRGYRSMINQRLVSQGTSGIDPGSSATLSSCNIVEGSTRSVELSTNESHDKLASSSSQRITTLHQQVVTTSSSSTSTSASGGVTPSTQIRAPCGPSMDNSDKDDEKLAAPAIEQNETNIESTDQTQSNETRTSAAEQLLSEEEEEDEDIKAARSSLKLHLDRVKDTENFLKSIRAEEENLERRRQQLNLFNDLIFGSKNNVQSRNADTKSAPVSSLLSNDINGFLPAVPPTYNQLLDSDHCDYKLRLPIAQMSSPSKPKPTLDLSQLGSGAIGFRPSPLTANESWRSTRSRSQLSDQFCDSRRLPRPLSANLDTLTLKDTSYNDLLNHNVYFPSRARRGSSVLRRPNCALSTHSQLLDLTPTSDAYRAPSPARSYEISNDNEMNSSCRVRARSSTVQLTDHVDGDDDDDDMRAYRASHYVPKVVPQGIPARGRTARRRIWDLPEADRPSESGQRRASLGKSSGEKEDPVQVREPIRRARAMSSVRDEDSTGTQQVSARRFSLSSDPTASSVDNSRLNELEKRIQANKQRREELLASSRPLSLVRGQSTGGNQAEVEINETNLKRHMRESSPAKCSPNHRAPGNKLARPSRLESMEARIKRRSYCVRMSSPERTRKQSCESASSSPARGSLASRSFSRD